MSRWVESILRVGGALLLAGVSASCSGAAADAVKPDMPTGADALGGSECKGSGEDVDELWVVDLSGPKRNALVNAMQKGLVFVSYDCKELKVLNGCKPKGLPARYEYGGTGHRKDVHELAGSDMVKFSLSGGAVIAAKLETELKSGTQLNIAYALVGMRSAPLQSLAVNQLGDNCEDATHFVSAAHLGAFRMTRGSAAEVGAALKVFEQGAEAASKSSEKAESEDGNGSICPRGETERGAAINGCDSPVQVELRAISKTPAAEDDLPPPPPDVPPPPRCPPGMKAAGGRCVSGAKAASPTCKPSDPAECSKSCSGGDPRSCVHSGLALEKGKGVQTNLKAAYAAYDKACAKGDWEGCAGKGILMSRGDGVERDTAAATKVLESACDKGSGRACSGRGNMLRVEGKAADALSWLDRGCNLRYFAACYYAGALRDKKDDQRAYQSHLRACRGGEIRGCLALTVLLQSGRAKDPEAPTGPELKTLLGNVLKGLDRRCTGRDAQSCEILADWYTGKYDPKVNESDKAKEYFGKACNLGQTDACKDKGPSGPPKPGSPPTPPPKGPPKAPPKGPPGPPKGPPGPPKAPPKK